MGECCAAGLLHYPAARATAGDCAASERSRKDAANNYGAVPPAEEGKRGDASVGHGVGVLHRGGGRGGGGCTLDDLVAFDGTACLPNVFAVSSWVEYEGAATMLWICKDLAWWLAAEKRVPGADAAMCVVGVVLVLHHADMLVKAHAKGDVMGMGVLVTLLFWVCAMFSWAVGELYQSEEVCAVVPLMARPEHPDNLRYIGSWIMLAGGVCCGF